MFVLFVEKCYFLLFLFVGKTEIRLCSQLFIQEFRKRLEETQNQRKHNKPWKTFFWIPSATAKGKEATSRQTWSATIPRSPLHCTHGGRDTGSSDEHFATVPTTACTKGSSLQVSLLICSWWRYEQENIHVCLCAYKPKWVSGNRDSDGCGCHGPQEREWQVRCGFLCKLVWLGSSQLCCCLCSTFPRAMQEILVSEGVCLISFSSSHMVWKNIHGKLYVLCYWYMQR